MFIILLVQFGLQCYHLLGNSCPLGSQFVLIVFCLFEILIYFPLWIKARDLPSDCPSSWSLLFYYFYRRRNELVSKFNVGLKSLLHQGLLEPEFEDIVYKLIIDNNNSLQT